MKLFLKVFAVFIIGTFAFTSYPQENSAVNYRRITKPFLPQMCGTFASEEDEIRTKQILENSRLEYINNCSPKGYYCLNYDSSTCNKTSYPEADITSCTNNMNVGTGTCFGKEGEELKLFTSEDDCKKFYGLKDNKRSCGTTEYMEQMQALMKMCGYKEKYCYSAYSPGFCETVSMPLNNSNECANLISYNSCLMGEDSKLFDSKQECVSFYSKNKPSVNYPAAQFIKSLLLNKEPNKAMIDQACQQACGETYNNFRLKKDQENDNIVTCLDNNPITPKTIVKDNEANMNTEDKTRMGCMYVEGKKNSDIIYEMNEALSDYYASEGEDLKDRDFLLKLAEGIDIDLKEDAEKNYKIVNTKNSSWCIKENLVYNNMNLGKYFKCAGKLK